METRKINKKESGITLIALVITIIVLIILASVSIGVLVGENGIIKMAKKAKEEYNKSQKIEDIKIEVSTSITKKGKFDYKDIIYSLRNKKGVSVEKINNSLLIDYEGNEILLNESQSVEFTKENVREGIHIGDYVDYIPENEDVEKLSWRVLKIYKNGIIKLVGNETKQQIRLIGEEGYNEGVSKLNLICENSYSNKKHSIIARNINIKDIEECFEKNSRADRFRKSIDNIYISYNGYKEGEQYENRYYPNLYSKEKYSQIDDKMQGYLEANDNEIEKGKEKAKKELSIKQTLYGTYINEEDLISGSEEMIKPQKPYWIATRSVHGYKYKAGFGIRCMFTDYLGWTQLFESTSEKEGGAYYSLKPVIYIDSGTRIDLSNGTNNKNNPHKIVFE